MGLSTYREQRNSGKAPCLNASPQRRVRIIHHATRLFLDQGYAATTLENVAHAAGVAKVAIYQLIGDKTELFAQCMVEAVKSNGFNPATLLSRDRPMKEALTDFAEQHILRMLNPVFQSRPYYEFVRLLLSTSITHPDISSQCIAMLRSEEAAPLEEYMEAMLEKGELSGESAFILTRLFMQTIFFTNNVLLDRSAADGYRNTREAAQSSVNFFLNGCLAR